MVLNITTPKRILYFQILARTKKYFHLHNIKDIVEDEEKRYYIFIRKRNIQIQIIQQDEAVINEIEHYLNFTFEKRYLGIDKNYFNLINLHDVRMVKM